MANNSDYQRAFARELINSMGVDGAIYIAQQHHWDGVLAHCLRAQAEDRVQACAA